MTSRIPPHLSDDMIERMLAERATFDGSMDVVHSIVGAASTTRQRRLWWPGGWRSGARGRRTSAFVFAAILTVAVLGAVVAVVGSNPRRTLNDLVVVPSPPTSSGLAVLPTTRPSAPEATALVTPTPTPLPTPSAADETFCGSTPPTDKPRVTTIDLPAKAYAGMAFAGCAVWILNNANGVGVHRVDVGTGKLAGVVLDGPIQSPVAHISALGDDLWAIQLAERPMLVRLDASTGKQIDSFPIPRAGLSGGFWITGPDAWVGPDVFDRKGSLEVVDLDTHQVVATIPDLAPTALWEDMDAIWALAPPAGSAGAPTSDQDLVRIDRSTFAVSRMAAPWQRPDDLTTPATDARGTFVGRPSGIIQVSPERGTIVRHIALDGASGGALVATTGTDLWAIPFTTVAPSKGSGFDTTSRELLKIDPTTGATVERIPLEANGLATFDQLRYAYGSLWINAPDADYNHTFEMHLIRVELPVGP
jgi:hypothetical protein